MLLSLAVEKPQFFIEGNEAAALGAHYGGVQLLAWYPITPSSSLLKASSIHPSSSNRRRRQRHDGGHSG